MAKTYNWMGGRGIHINRSKVPSVESTPIFLFYKVWFLLLEVGEFLRDGRLVRVVLHFGQHEGAGELLLPIHDDGWMRNCKWGGKHTWDGEKQKHVVIRFRLSLVPWLSFSLILVTARSLLRAVISRWRHLRSSFTTWGLSESPSTWKNISWQLDEFAGLCLKKNKIDLKQNGSFFFV